MSESAYLLKHGSDHLAIPGPSVIPDRVLRAMQRPAPNIYGGELVDITGSLKADLNALAGNSGNVALYIGNGHAAWEACLANTFSRGDKVLFLINGRFGLGWANAAMAMGIDAQMLDFGQEKAVDAAAVEQLLLNDNSHSIKAVLTVHTDTATSSSNDLAAIRKAIDSANHPALYIVDSIASFACEAFHMDELRVDVMLTASQKGLMSPPGMAMLFLGERFWSCYEEADLVTPYWNIHPRVYPPMFPDNFNGTPPTHHMFALREALDMLLEEGIENTWRRHEVMARAVWAAVDVWSRDGDIAFNVSDESMRSRAVTLIKTPAGAGADLQRLCNERFGVVLGVALNPDPTATVLDSAFRIGHMGHINPPGLLGTLGSIEAGLKALNVKHSRGAVDAAASVLSESICG